MQHQHYGISVTDDGYAIVTWHDEQGEVQDAELDVESADVKEALALLRKIIWG